MIIVSEGDALTHTLSLCIYIYFIYIISKLFHGTKSSKYISLALYVFLAPFCMLISELVHQLRHSHHAFLLFWCSVNVFSQSRSKLVSQYCLRVSAILCKFNSFTKRPWISKYLKAEDYYFTLVVMQHLLPLCCWSTNVLGVLPSYQSIAFK